MNRGAALIRAMRGPLMLVVLGGLLAMARFQEVSFTKTWPVLLIALGLLKLAERLAMRPAAPAVGQE
jgi:hypothetical protein